MNYRTRLDIIAQILEAADGGATKTKIMYKAFLSQEQLRMHLGDLIATGLLSQKGIHFETTDKGQRFIKLYSRMNVTIRTLNGLQSPIQSAV